MPYCIIQAPFGHLRIDEDAGAIVGVRRVEAACVPASTVLLRACVRQLEAYLAGETRTFDLPLRLEGTVFRRKVWAALQQIPYGEVRTYAQLAAMLGQPNACRAVGGANHHNPICIIVPCHRVIGADGSLTGYAGGLEMKQWLLRHEGCLL